MGRPSPRLGGRIEGLVQGLEVFVEALDEPFSGAVGQRIIRAVVKGLEGPAMVFAGPPQLARRTLLELADGFPEVGDWLFEGKPY